VAFPMQVNLMATICHCECNFSQTEGRFCLLYAICT
jgi:hypothetical protein